MNNTERAILIAIKDKLEERGIKCEEYYNGFIHKSGPVNDFFKTVNEGTYTVEVLVIPQRFYKLDLEAIEKFLEE